MEHTSKLHLFNTCLANDRENLNSVIPVVLLCYKRTVPSMCYLQLHITKVKKFVLQGKKTVRRPGIEPGSQEWESCMIPLHQRRDK